MLQKYKDKKDIKEILMRMKFKINASSESDNDEDDIEPMRTDQRDNKEQVSYIYFKSH